MKNIKWIVIGGFIGLALLVLLSGISKYNNFVSLDEQVSQQWSQVENQYKRRYDLIPNLVSTVKGYATHEQETLENVVKARSAATNTNVNIKDIDQLKAFNANQSSLSSALSKLMVVVEKYPDLKANESFMNLQVNLEGTENRIATARMDYNKAVKEYNVAIKQFPGNMWAKMFSFEQANMFEAADAEMENVEVKFKKNI